MYRYKQPQFIIPALLTLSVVLGIIFGIILYNVSVGAVEEIQKFDHSQCQYPNRLSNPPDGCDNTDPAQPECMKGGTESCEIKPVEIPPVIIEKEKECK